MFSNRRTKWLAVTLMILVGALISGKLTAGESSAFSPQQGVIHALVSLESMLWLMGSALLGMIGVKRFNSAKGRY